MQAYIALIWGLPASFSCLETALLSKGLSQWKRLWFEKHCVWRYINLQVQYSTVQNLAYPHSISRTTQTFYRAIIQKASSFTLAIQGHNRIGLLYLDHEDMGFLSSLRNLPARWPHVSFQVSMIGLLHHVVCCDENNACGFWFNICHRINYCTAVTVDVSCDNCSATCILTWNESILTHALSIIWIVLKWRCHAVLIRSTWNILQVE